MSTPFHYHNGHLYCEQVNLTEIAATVGTPAYVYSAAHIQKQVAQLKNAFPKAALHYSLKANANLSLIRYLRQQGLGMDAVSAGEVFRALTAGVPASDIVFAGVGKTADEIDYALQNNIGCFNVESLAELILLNQLAQNRHQTATVALRLNPAIQAQTHHHIATGHSGAKFGIDAPTIREILAHQDAYPAINFTGLHIHIGSQLASIAETLEAIHRAQEIAAPYPTLRTLNIGGGFPVNYTENDHYPQLQDFANTINPLTNDWHLKLEPGRFIVAAAGALLISVLYQKKQGDANFLITDGSMTELIRPALYNAHHPILPLQQTDAQSIDFTIAGPVCESADILSPKVALPMLKSGEYLAVLMAGAYGFVMASNYNQRPRPPELWIDGSTWRIIRQRETWQDLIRLEE